MFILKVSINVLYYPSMEILFSVFLNCTTYLYCSADLYIWKHAMQFHCNPINTLLQPCPSSMLCMSVYFPGLPHAYVAWMSRIAPGSDAMLSALVVWEMGLDAVLPYTLAMYVSMHLELPLKGAYKLFLWLQLTVCKLLPSVLSFI